MPRPHRQPLQTRDQRTELVAYKAQDPCTPTNKSY